MAFIEVTDREDNSLTLVNTAQVRSVLDDGVGAIIVMTPSGQLVYNIRTVEMYATVRKFIESAEGS